MMGGERGWLSGSSLSEKRGGRLDMLKTLPKAKRRRMVSWFLSL